MERYNTSNTDLQPILQNINKFAASQTKPILTNTRSRRSQKSCSEFWRLFRTPILYKIRESYTKWEF